jgi:hypothetical protein
MQLAGTLCAICKQNVLLDSDATWCARCSTVIHRPCLASADGICPACHKTYDEPESHFVFSSLCPVCFRPNNPPQAQCRSCAARTRWDTQVAYNDFKAHMKDTSRVYILRSLAELVGGILCLLAFVSMLFIGPMRILIGVLLVGFMTLTAHGVVSLIRSRRIAKFR